MNAVAYAEMSPEKKREVDVLIARVEYLRKVIRAREEARADLQAQTGLELTPAQLDAMLTGPRP